jgi:hypothetical protein
MAGPAVCVASTATSTTGAAVRCWLLFKDPGELRQVNISAFSGTGAWKPVVYYVTSRTDNAPTYVTSYHQNGIVHSTNSVIGGGTFTTIFPDPTSATDVLLNPIAAAEWAANGVGNWEYTWKRGEGPMTRGGDNALSRNEVCVVVSGVGSTSTTSRMSINCIWEPQGG